MIICVCPNSADGLYLYDQYGSLHAICHIEKIYSAVGSGDCLVAGLSIATFKKYTLEKTAGLAAAAGTANCLRKDLGMLYKKDVDELFQKTIITKFYNDYPKKQMV